MKADKRDYIQPDRNLLTMIFGNAHRIDSLQLSQVWWLNESLVALERHNNNWDVFKTVEETRVGPSGDAHPHTAYEKIKDNISAQEARNLIQSHNEAVAALRDKKQHELAP